MRAEELRIGNLVEYGIGREPVSITGHDLFAGVEGRPFRPILLTEYWLKRFGFKINTKRDDESVSFDYMNIGLFYIGMFNDEGWLLDAFDSMPPMQYVHQLQNLYFALTGEELKLN